MTLMRTTLSLVAAGALCAAGIAVPAAQQEPDVLTVPFSDPSRPGTVQVETLSGSITVRGGARKDVQITARGRGDSARAPREAPPGLRRLTQAAGFEIEESGNVMEIESDSNRFVDFEILVPAQTNLELESVNGGITVEGVEGTLEIESVNGAIVLNSVAGSVVAETTNGRVAATLTRVMPDTPMSFAAFNGDVDVTLPASIRATFKLRSERGEVFTDLDLQLQPQPAPASRRNSDGQTRIEVNRAIYGTVNGGGPEIEMRTFNGNVYVRRAAQ